MPFVNQYDWWKMAAWVVSGLNQHDCLSVSIIFVFVLHLIVVQIISIFFLYLDISSSSSTGGMKTEPLMKGN